MCRALLLIDIQNDYFPGGRMELSGAEKAGAAAGKLLAAFRKKGLPVIHIQHIANHPNATFFLPGTAGAAIHPSVTPQEGEALFTKHLPSSFQDTPLLAHLRKHQISDLTIAGMMTHMCVDTTVRAAFELGFACTLACDACATKDLQFLNEKVAAKAVQIAYLAALHGLFAKALPTEEIIAGL